MSETKKSKETWYDECVALQQDGELALAVAELKKLIEAYPEYPLARLALAVFEQEKGNESAALEAMQAACDLERDDPFYFTAFSALAIKCGDHERAEAALMKAQEARLEEQLRKMNELRNQELAARAERDKAAAEAGTSADESNADESGADEANESASNE